MPDWILAARDDDESATLEARVALAGRVDAIMKGHLHTDVLMHGLLSSVAALRLPVRRVSHAFVTDVSTDPKLLFITDAAVNIPPI